MAEKILVVEDEVSFCKMLETVLQHEGYCTHAAHDGLQALRAAREWQPDLVLLDVMIPQLDGLQTLKQLKENPETREARVIILSGRDDDDCVVTAWDHGADAFLSKVPFHASELLAFIRRLLEAKQEDAYRVMCPN